jgi:primosomal protein N' (replication factor Y) (superfamily II helicase)
MPTYVEIAVNVPRVTGVFHYHLPPELEGRVAVGHLAIVPFGRQTVQGVVVRFVTDPAVPETRPVLDLVDPAPVLTSVQLALAHFLSETYLAPLAACIDLMLPPGLGQQADTIYSAVASAQPLKSPSDAQKRLLDLLKKRGPLRGSQVDLALPRLNWRAAARSLLNHGQITALSVLPPPSVHAKLVRTVQLACPQETAEGSLAALGKPASKSLERRQAMLRFLLREPGPVDVAWVYAESGGNLIDLRYLAERGLVVLGESEVWRDPMEQVVDQPTSAPPLTRDQQTAWEHVQNQLREAAAGRTVLPVLLHGVTSSGKTEIYLRAVEEIIRMGKQAIILVPEISLTPQTVRRFSGRFPGQVGLVHSRLSAGERYDTWRRSRLGLLPVVVGPRSALFTPFGKLGLIVVDEFHDDSYYQSDPPPSYHAREAAIAYARLAGAVCLLGSATPDVVSVYQASQGHWQYLRMPERVLAHTQAVRAQVERLGIASNFQPLEGQAETISLPPVQVVDMRLELQSGNRSIFSRQLQAALTKALEQEEQAILFLNRRGTATYVFCRNCGYVLKCPRCDLPLTYHILSPSNEADHVLVLGAEARPALICHSCGYNRKLPSTCPQCSSRQIRQYGTGTERVEVEVQTLFPKARTLRWDYETTRHKGAHEVILGHFASHRADVLIGTQMLAKGLDLPLVTLVGVVLADVGLNLPDYRSPERTFQLLTQVAGRAGRSPLGGQVILQTFQPEHYAIQAASRHDYKAFYRQEIVYRRHLGYPPFTRVVRLEYRHTEAKQAEREARKLAEQIHTWLADEARRATQIAGPVPCFFTRQAGKYRWQIVLRGPDPVALLKGRPLGDWQVEIDPISLL